MSRTAVVTYHSLLTDAGSSDSFSRFALRFRSCLASKEWPYDIGDDPAFFSARQLQGPVTWGVCRQDVRNQLKTGDTVLFFAVAFGHERHSAEYRFSAALTVARLVSAEQVFLAPEFEKFQLYLNLLIRPASDGWDHFEPALPRDAWHGDWLWRICEHTRLKKQDFLEAGKCDRCLTRPLVAGQPVKFAANYVIFSNAPSASLIMDEPPLVARWEHSNPHEEWLPTPLARDIYSRAFANASRAHLRTCNKQQPNRHFWTESSPSAQPIVSAIRAAVSGA